jgi:hypothetical protein
MRRSRGFPLSAVPLLHREVLLLGAPSSSAELAEDLSEIEKQAKVWIQKMVLN